MLKPYNLNCYITTSTLLIFFLLFLLFGFNFPENMKVEKSIIKNDTIISIFPFSMYNENGNATVTAIKNYKSGKLINSKFIIELKKFKSYNLIKEISMSDLIILNKNNPKGLKYLKNAQIENIKFAFVRCNTLYFNINLINTIDKSNVDVKLNLFFQTNKKGVLYHGIIE
ncbi:MAG: hypothetical protein RLZZ175_208 [Bacteroidota bacterium]|jgi:hypothetical protein